MLVGAVILEGKTLADGRALELGADAACQARVHLLSMALRTARFHTGLQSRIEEIGQALLRNTLLTAPDGLRRMQQGGVTGGCGQGGCAIRRQGESHADAIACFRIIECGFRAVLSRATLNELHCHILPMMQSRMRSTLCCPTAEWHCSPTPACC